jgi:rhodanese-related sulfurtransferase
MKNTGFEYVKDLAGGTDGWIEAGYKLVERQ